MQRSILITGTTRGIGQRLAQHHLANGWSVGGCGRQAATIEHDAYSHYVLDLADEPAVVAMVRDFAKKHGGIGALINNAGIAAMNHVLTTPGQSAHQIMATNFLGSFYALREASKVMSRTKHGRIVNFTTIAVPMHIAGEAVYAASKAAVECLTRIAAHELGPLGITVNAIGPAPMQTDLIKAVPEAKINKLLSRQAIPRLGTFDDVLNVTDFFLSDRSDFVTGQIIYLGGVVA